jgi:nitrogen regulatory protein P-II 1
MNLYRVTAYIRPHKLEEVKTAAAGLGITGMTFSDARGCGSSPEQSASIGGHEILVSLPIRSKLEIAVEEELLEPLIAAITQSARTGENGDGKIFVEELSDVVRIRTGEQGPAAV